MWIFYRPAFPLTHKNQGSNGGLTPKICKQAETYAVSAVFLSKAGEIKPAKDFYDYEDKYINGTSTYDIPANIKAEDMEDIRRMAIEAFKGIDGKGLSRVDFFIDKDSGEIFINEINTLPGFTNISMYPKMWEATGLEYSKLIDRLIELALDSKK